MKPPDFTYHRPDTVAEALETLAEFGAEAKVLAGGQSLIPLLNMRLAAPRHLVDINRLTPWLGHIEPASGAAGGGAAGGGAPGGGAPSGGAPSGDPPTDRASTATVLPTTVLPTTVLPTTVLPTTVLRASAPAGSAVTIGALVRHSQTERSPAVLPLIREATRNVAHAAIRNRGTTVGSIAHADPAAELPAVLVLCGGTLRVASTGGQRSIAVADFLVGPLQTALRPGELVLSAQFVAPPPRSGSAWVEVSRRAGDFAVCGAGVVVTLSPDQRITRAVAAYISVGPTPVRVELTDAVGDQRADRADWVAAGNLARARVAPEADLHASAEYRRQLVGVLTERAGRIAAGRAGSAAMIDD